MSSFRSNRKQAADLAAAHLFEKSRRTPFLVLPVAWIVEKSARKIAVNVAEIKLTEAPEIRSLKIKSVENQIDRNVWILFGCCLTWLIAFGYLLGKILPLSLHYFGSINTQLLFVAYTVLLTAWMVRSIGFSSESLVALRLQAWEAGGSAGIDPLLASIPDASNLYLTNRQCKSLIQKLRLLLILLASADDGHEPKPQYFVNVIRYLRIVRKPLSYRSEVERLTAEIEVRIHKVTSFE